jgi:hypothetical protein
MLNILVFEQSEAPLGYPPFLHHVMWNRHRHLATPLTETPPSFLPLTAIENLVDIMSLFIKFMSVILQ